jgi:hypothetical protein
MDITSIEIPDSPMNYVCSQVKEALSEFINREATYIYSSYDKRKLFSLENREDFVKNSILSVDEYIIKHNLEYKWKRMNIKENFSYKQQKRFEKSGMTLDEYIESNDLYTSTITSDKETESNEIDLLMIYEDDGDDYYDYSDDDNDGWGIK